MAAGGRGGEEFASLKKMEKHTEQAEVTFRAKKGVQNAGQGKTAVE